MLGAIRNSCRRVLVVDDNLSIHDDLRKILCPPAAANKAIDAREAALFGQAPPPPNVVVPPEGITFEMDSAYQGQEALGRVRAAVQEGRPYLMCFMDVRMPPGWDGIETTARIWEVDPGIQIVIATAYSDYTCGQMTEKLGLTDKYVILKKPFDALEALQLANACTEKWLLEQKREQAIQERTAELAATQLRLEHLFRSSPAIIYSLKSNGHDRLTFISHNVTMMLGHHPAEFLETPQFWSQHVHPDDAPLFRDHRFQLVKGEFHAVKYRFQTRDGSYCWLHDEARVVRDERGIPVEIVGSCLDITDRVESEAAIRRSEERYRLVAENSLDVVWVLDLETQRFRYVSPSVERLRGYTADEVMVQDMSAALTPESLDYLLQVLPERMARFREGGPSVYTDEIEQPCKDGSTVWTEAVTRYHTNEETGHLEVYGASRNIAERKRAEEAMRLQTSALKAAANGIVITDVTGHILWANPAFTQLTGFAATEVIGKTPALLKSGAHAKAFYQTMWNTILAGKVWQGEMVNRRKDGSQYCEEMTVTPVLDLNGKIQNFIAIKQDVSQRKQFDQMLAAERDLFQTLLDNVPDNIYFKDGQLRYTRVNQAQARLMGLGNPAEAIGKTDRDVFPSGHWRQTFVDEQRILATGEPLVDRWERIPHPSGRTLWIASTKIPLRDREGNITALVGISRDITERKLAEEQLSYERDLLRTLMENSPDLIYFKDCQSRFIRCSHTMIERFGCTRMTDVAGKTDFDFYSEAHARPAYADEQEIIRTGKPLEAKVESETWKNSGRVTWAITSKMPLRDKDGKIIGTFGISKDITALKQAEQAQQLMEIQLRQAQKLEAIGQLAAGIAHEINTPTQYVGDNTRFLKDSFESIAKVLGAYDELLRAAKNNSVTPELVARVDESLAAADLRYLFEQVPAAIKETLEGVERVSKIVRAMKEFSHPGSKEKALSDLNKAIETTTTVARNEWKYVADLELELDPQLPPVPCFVGEFNQCILNLVVNAAHAIGDAIRQQPGSKGKITVRTGRHNGHVEVRVSDTGTGIPEAVRPRIFEPFFTTKDIGKGTGQGLSIVYNTIVKKHGGTASFETETGRGTTFILRLPLAPLNGVTAPKPEEAASSKPEPGSPALPSPPPEALSE